jgi:hypothetical protein
VNFSTIVKMMNGVGKWFGYSLDELSGRNLQCDSCVVEKHTRKPFISLECRSSGQLELMFVVLFDVVLMRWIRFVYR